MTVFFVSPCRIICMLCQQTSSKRCFANVSITSYCDVTTTIRHCSLLEFGKGYTIKQSPRASPDRCCQSCGFPACFFVELRIFSKACGLLVFGLALIEICLFFGFVFCRFLFCGLFFFSNLMELLLFQFTAKDILGVLLWKFAHFGLVFLDLPPCFFI